METAALGEGSSSVAQLSSLVLSVSFPSVPPSAPASQAGGFQQRYPREHPQPSPRALLYTETCKTSIAFLQPPSGTRQSPVHHAANSAPVCGSPASPFCISPTQPHAMGATAAETIGLHFDCIFSILLHFFFFFPTSFIFLVVLAESRWQRQCPLLHCGRGFLLLFVFLSSREAGSEARSRISPPAVCPDSPAVPKITLLPSLPLALLLSPPLQRNGQEG